MNPRLVWTSIVVLVIFTVFIGILYSRVNSNDGIATLEDPVDEPPPSSTVMGSFKAAAVVANGQQCATIGRNILKKGGNAIDAIIATALCDGVVFPQNTGLGGGFLMTYYNKAENKVYTINAREMAPGKATENMFHGDQNLSQRGGLSIGVPAELKGFWTMYNQFGSKVVSWSDLFNETITLCRQGIPVTSYLAEHAKNYAPKYQNYSALKNLLTNPKTGKTWKEGELMYRLKLADTLEVFQKEGGDALHDGSLTKNFLSDLHDAGSIISEDDLKNYTVKIETASVTASLSDGMTLYSVPLPGSGPIIAYILTLLDGLVPSNNIGSDFVKIVEAFKFAYARRSEFGDPDFINDGEVLSSMKDPQKIRQVREEIGKLQTSQDPAYYGANFSQVPNHGTANMAVLAPNGDAVVMTSTVNLIFGSFVLSESTGILLNDCMDDFSSPFVINYFDLPPSPANYIRPYKRPISSMCPSIVLDKNGDVRLLVGSAGGTKITTATAEVAMLNLWYNKTIKEAVDYRRVHHQVFPMAVSYEFGTTKSVVDALKKAGHQLERLTDKNHFGTAVTAIAKKDNIITTGYDPRRIGGFSGF